MQTSCTGKVGFYVITRVSPTHAKGHTAPGFKEVVAYLLRDSSSLAPTEAPPEIRQPYTLMGPAVTMMYATCIVQDEATGVTYMDTVTTSVGRVALGIPTWWATSEGLL